MNLEKLIVSIFILFNSIYTYSQNFVCFHLADDMAVQLVEGEEYENAFEIYNEIWDLIPYKPVKSCLYASKCCFALKQFSLGKRYLLEAIESGTLLEELEDVGIDKVMSEQEWNNLKLFYEVERKNFLYDFDFELYDEINQMYSNDQFMRKHIVSSDTASWKYFYIVDSINFHKFKSIIKTKGFPSASKIGKLGMRNLDVILLHFGGLNNQNDWEYIDSLLVSQMKTGRVFPIHYAILVDRRMKNRIGKGVYGTMLKGDGIIPVTNEAELDVIRRSIGLYSLKRQAEIMPLIKEFPKDYIPSVLSIEEILESCK